MEENILKTEQIYSIKAFFEIASFSKSYSEYHGWLTTMVCLIGIFFNTTIIIAMNNNKQFSFQTILISIACADSIVMAFYLPYSIHFYILNSNFIYSNLNEKCVQL